MELILIAAVSKNFTIGKEGKIPWLYKTELEHFKKTTIGFPVIMGRVTWESIKKPLENRTNIVLSKENQLLLKNDEILVFEELEKAVTYCKEKMFDKCFIIGGESIYKLAMKIADKIVLSMFDFEIEGDRYFPKIEDEWVEIENQKFQDFTVHTYIRKVNKED